MPARFFPLTLLALLAFSAAASAAWEERWLKAARAIGSGQEAEVVLLWGDAMSARPDTLEGHFQRGLDWRAKEKRAHAEEEFSAALRIDPIHAPSLAARAMMRYELGKLKPALKDADAAIRADSTFALGHFARARVHHMAGMFDDKITRDEIEKTIACDPAMAAAYYIRSGSKKTDDDLEGALADANKTIELNDHQASYRERRAILFFEAKRFAEAMADWGKAIEVAPGNGIYRVAHGQARLMLEDFTGAIKDADEGARLDRNTFCQAFAAEVRGRAYNKMERFDDALRELDRALKLDPDRGNAWFARMWTRTVRGEYVKALTDSRKANALLGPDTNLMQIRTEILLCLNRPGIAAKEGQAGLKLAGWSTEQSAYFAIFTWLAERKAGRQPAARKILEAAAQQLSYKDWPVPVLDFFAGKRSADDLLAAAKNDDERLEARAYLGLHALLAGNRDEALPHLRWVRAHGAGTSAEFNFASAELDRIDHPEAVAQADE